MKRLQTCLNVCVYFATIAALEQDMLNVLNISLHFCNVHVCLTVVALEKERPAPMVGFSDRFAFSCKHPAIRLNTSAHWTESLFCFPETMKDPQIFRSNCQTRVPLIFANSKGFVLMPDGVVFPCFIQCTPDTTASHE